MDKNEINEATNWVDIFGAKLDCNSLNCLINDFENKSKDKPYIFMSTETLSIFRYLSAPLDCDDVDCDSYEDCDCCPVVNNNNEVVVTNKSKNETTEYFYFYKDEYYRIVIDDELAFGVVKAR